MTGGAIFLAVFVFVLAAVSVVSFVATIRQRRVSTRVRVAKLRESFRRTEPGEEIVIRPDACWSLSQEMIMEVVVEERCRFVRDTTVFVGRWKHHAMVFTGPATASHDG